MITSERTQQFIYLLSAIHDIVEKGIQSKDAAIIAFANTAEHFGIATDTVRDMVTRSCKVKRIAQFYTAINKLYEGDILTFKNLYFSQIPRVHHVEIESLCKRFVDMAKSSSTCSPNMIFLMKKVATMHEADEKRALIKLLQSQQPAQL